MTERATAAGLSALSQYIGIIVVIILTPIMITVSYSGGIMLICGVIGALILPILSDKVRKRKIFLVICMIGMIPGIAGLHLSTAYPLAMISSFFLVFFVMSAGPIGFQYAAEVSFPTPESTSQGMILLVGQISGLIFVAGMGTPGVLNFFMYAFIGFAVIALIGSLMLGESPMMKDS